MTENPPTEPGPTPGDPVDPSPAPSPPDAAYGYPPQHGPAYGAPSPSGWAQPQPPALLGPSEERTWAGVAHWGALVSALIGGLSFLGPLLVLLIQGNKSPYVRRHAVESLNFQLSVLIYGLVSALLVLVLVGIFLLIALGVMWLVFPIIASIKAANGEEYRYPLTIRMVS